MSLRIFSVTGLALVLAACGSGPDGDAESLAEAEAMARKDVADSGMIECAVSGFTNFTRTCSVERAMEDDGLILTIRHDDGGFRRLRVMKDGSGVVAADGAEPAMVSTVGGNQIEVTLAGDKYRLPATVKGAEKAK
jgi:hypothetical protein